MNAVFDPEAVADVLREQRRAERIHIGGCLTLADAMPDAEYVLRPCLIQNQVVTLTARAGHGKSTLAIAMAGALALNRSVGPLHPVRPGRVYFVSAEDFDGTRKRIYAEAIRHKLTAEERDALDAKLFWVHVNETTAPSVIAEYLREHTRSLQISAIFVDTGPALFAGDDENDNAQLQDFAANCRCLTELYGAPAVVVFWHPVKNATADNLVPRGGSALLGAVDGNLTIWLDEETSVATLGHSAKWRADHFDPLVFTLETVPLVMPSGKPASIKIAVPAGETVRAKKPKAVRRDIAIDALRECLSEFGERLPPTSTIPPGTKAVTMEQWRRRWALRTGYDERDAESARVNFAKDRARLLADGAIAVSTPYVWTVI